MNPPSNPTSDSISGTTDGVAVAAPVGQVEITVDGTPVKIRKGQTILDACNALGVDTPTLCHLEGLTPVNVCRVCVVEVEGSRTLVPSCSRPAEEGMVVQTDSERVRHSRKMVLEFLDTSVDTSLATELNRWSETYEVDLDRYGDSPETAGQPIKIQDNLYIRNYDQCVLCYKCVEACGDDAQQTFAIAVAGRGFDAHISTEFDEELPESACVYCGNCVAVCPTGALMFTTEYNLRQDDNWREDDQTVTTTVCSYCGVGCNLDLHVQDDTIVKVTSPRDHDVTNGNLCVKGRFGWQYVHGS